MHTFVVGAGFAGLCMAIKLQEAGERDFLVAERGSDVGGTWRDNTYPGAACDVPSQLYSFSFAPNPHWSRSFSPQPEIQAYIQRVAERVRRARPVRLRHRRGGGALGRRRACGMCVDRRPAAPASYTADVLVSAAGALSDPKLPDIDGIDSFQGEIFHSAQWDHDYDLTGKRVAVIGTGASAIQIVPASGRAGRAPRRLPAHRAVRHPAHGPRLHRRWRGWRSSTCPACSGPTAPAIYWAPRDARARVRGRPEARAARQAARRSRTSAKGIKDPALRERVTPTFEIGCKRILISNDWYPALDRDDVDLVTDRITKITPTAVVTEDGTEREIDVLIVATGFHATDLPIAARIHGRDGVSLADHFAEVGMQAYKGATVHGFPNLFFIVGPNTGLGHSSMVFMIESQVAYAVDAVTHDARAGRRSGRADRRRRSSAWNDDLQRRMKRTVWSTGGCSSWYLDEHGRNVTLWPRTTYKFRQLTSSVRHRELRRPARSLPHRRREGVRMKTLDGKVVVITGAGSGIGRALALRAADQGAILALSRLGRGRARRDRAAACRPGALGTARSAPTSSTCATGRRCTTTPRRPRVTSAGSTSSSTTPAWRCTVTSRRSPTRTSSGSWTSTSGASCRAPRSSCRT